MPNAISGSARVSSHTAASNVSARLSETIAALFPPGVTATELAGTGDVAALDDVERAQCSAFGRKRRADFAAGRACARAALEHLGYAGYSLAIGSDRRPLWPAGIVGSISHATGYCGAVVGRSGDVASLGLDIERIGRVEEELWPTLFTDDERRGLRALGAERGRAETATILFSVKEAFYKCRFGLEPSWLDFTDVTVELEPDQRAGGAFIARIVASGHASILHGVGRYRICGNFALAGIAVSENFSTANNPCS